MTLSERIIAYILNHHPITYREIEEVAMGKGFSQLAIMDAMELVHKDKRVDQSTRRDDIVYRPYIAPVVKSPFKSTVPYPYPGRDGIPEFVMPWPDWDLSYILLSPEELEEYKAKAKGRTFIPKKRYERKGKQSTERSVELSPTQRSLLLAQQQHSAV